MGMVALKCPSCGSNIELDDTREFGFCSYCGTKVIQEKIVVEHRGSVELDESKKYSNCITLADNAFAVNNMQEAYDYYTRALESNQDSYYPFFKKAMSAAYLSLNGKDRSEEVVNGINTAFRLGNDSDDAYVHQSIREFVKRCVISPKNRFNSKEEVCQYIDAIVNRVTLLDKMYEFADRDKPQEVLAYSDIVVNLCRLFRNEYLYADVQFVNGQRVLKQVPLRTSQSARNRVHNIYVRFINESNQYLSPKIDSKAAEIQEIRQNIKDLPIVFKLLHAVFCKTMLWIAGILYFLYFPIGGPLLLIEIACFIVYRVLDKDEYVHGLYMGLIDKQKEFVALKNQLKR